MVAALLNSETSGTKKTLGTREGNPAPLRPLSHLFPVYFAGMRAKLNKLFTATIIFCHFIANLSPNGFGDRGIFFEVSFDISLWNNGIRVQVFKEQERPYNMVLRTMF